MEDHIRRTPERRKKSRTQAAITSFISSGPNSVKEDVQFKVPFLPLTSPAESTPAAFKRDFPLYAHQERSLYRMLQIESRDESVTKFNFGMLDYYSKGGCLADAIGMGKTATMLALIVSEPRDPEAGGNLLVAPSHLLAQWRLEVEKFVHDGEIDVVMGMRAYLAMDKWQISNRTLVLVGVEDAVKSPAYYYHFHNIYNRELRKAGRPLHVDKNALAQYQEAAKFVNKAYSGLVWTTKLHLPDKPWRRVIFEEVQDLVLPGKESQDCFIQLTHRCQNVWLITATPFPEKAESIYANNQLLGFKRLRLLPHDPAFNEIKMKLYLRNCAQVKQDAITNKIAVHETYVSVKLHPRELLLYRIERVLANTRMEELFDMSEDAPRDVKSLDTDNQVDTSLRTAADLSNELWSEKYKCARQSCVHVGISDRILDRDRKKSSQSELALSVSVKSPSEVFKNEKYHLDRQLALVKMRKKEMEMMERATHNTIVICNAILNQVYWSVAECFADMNGCGLDTIFNDRGETEAGFRMLSKHYKMIGNTIPDPTEFIMYDQDEIEGYLRKHFDSLPQIEQLRNIMESTLKTRCPRARVFVDEQLKQIEECLVLKNSLEVVEETTKIPFFGTKILKLIQYLKTLQTIKVVIFTMWPAALRVLERALELDKITCAVFLQHQSSETKSAHVMSFLNGDVQVLLLNSLTSASGINLQVASHVIFLDPVGYSAAQASTLEQQAIGRVLRMGQTNKEVSVVRFVAEQTMEAALYDEIHETTTKTVAAEETFFDGERADSEAYVCVDFDAPIRRVIRMTNSSSGTDENESTRQESNGGSEDDDSSEAIEITGSMSLEEIINQRIQTASASGVVFDLTEDAEEDFEHQLAAAPSIVDTSISGPQRKKRRAEPPARTNQSSSSLMSNSFMQQSEMADTIIKSELQRVN